MTIIEILENALFNIKSKSGFGTGVGIRQLENAIALLEKGYDANNDDVDALLDDVESAPEK
jgi:hypothetical protein